MKKQTDIGFEEIRILVFSIMGVNLGMDMEQISEMCEPDQVRERDFEIFRFHDKLLFREDPGEYESPVVLLVKDETSGLIIEQPDDINVPVPIDSICPLPPLIEAVIRSGPIWGVTINQGKIILLVDSYKLLQ
ncbi:MAG: hypothetical protein GY795_43535 [Desulfobacterales bacterium]|nr:hypothetical protein [Desulfobacterales bacterium]